MIRPYDPWHVQSRQLPSNLRRVAQGRGEGRTLSVQVSNPAPATNSPPVTVIAVRCKTEPNAFRIRLPAHSQANPMADDNWRGGRSLIGRSLPASFSRGPFGRTMNFCGSLSRWSFQPLVKFCQEPASSFTKSFKVLFGCLRHANEHDRRNGQSAVKE